MSEPNFWHGTRRKKKFHNKEELLAYCMEDFNVLRQACCAFRNLFLKLVKMDPFRQSVTIPSICNNNNNVSKIGYCRYYTREGVPYGRPSVCWSSSMACVYWSNKGRYNWCRKCEVHLPGLPNVNVDGYSPKAKYLGCFWHGCPCMSNRHKPIGTTEETLLTR